MGRLSTAECTYLPTYLLLLGPPLMNRHSMGTCSRFCCSLVDLRLRRPLRVPPRWIQSGARVRSRLGPLWMIQARLASLLGRLALSPC